MILVEDLDLRILNWVGWTIEYLDNYEIKIVAPFNDDLNFTNESQALDYLARIRKDYDEFIKKKNEIYTLIDNFTKVKSKRLCKKENCKNDKIELPNNNVLVFYLKLIKDEM
jgi:hypothetical protein